MSPNHNPTVLPISPSEFGESPFWNPTEKILYWCDITAFKLRSWSPGTGATRAWDLPSEPGCCAPADDGNVVIGLRDGFYLLNPHDAQIQSLGKLDHDINTLRLNDGRCDSQGRFWAGSVFTPKTANNAQLWRLQASPNGYQVDLMAGDNMTANGLAFSPDNRWMYWANTPSHSIGRFEFNSNNGSIDKFKEWISFPKKGESEIYIGRPDGASVDAEGNYWVAMYEGACILKISPDALVLQKVDVPVQCPTMVCFGGDDLQTIFVTSARTGRPQAELNAPTPAGSLLSFRVDVPGLPVNYFSTCKR